MIKDQIMWQSKSGPIAVDDMTESHAKNVLKMLIRNNRIKPVRERNTKWDHLYFDHLESKAQEEFC